MDIDLGPSCACGALLEDDAATCRKCTRRLRWRRRKAHGSHRDEGGLN